MNAEELGGIAAVYRTAREGDEVSADQKITTEKSTTVRSIHVQPHLWRRWAEAARRMGLSVSSLVRVAVEKHLAAESWSDEPRDQQTPSSTTHASEEE